MEIVAGEMETGVTRFVAVSVKTFVLSLGAACGLLMTVEQSGAVWAQQVRVQPHVFHRWRVLLLFVVLCRGTWKDTITILLLLQ